MTALIKIGEVFSPFRVLLFLIFVVGVVFVVKSPLILTLFVFGNILGALLLFYFFLCLAEGQWVNAREFYCTLFLLEVSERRERD